ncbi:putative ubiquitin conjugating enzyme ubc1 [Fusarium fujikuroi]|nr:putative ubiquitin conjugating enzyme ubc1 [Fusarium fujikuroi]
MALKRINKELTDLGRRQVGALEIHPLLALPAPSARICSTGKLRLWAL